MISEIRPRETDPSAYANRVVADVRRQIASGVPSSHITVIGASKGAVIASLVSSRLQDRGVRYVLLANCNDWLIRAHDPHLSGDVLSIYEKRAGRWLLLRDANMLSPVSSTRT